MDYVPPHLTSLKKETQTTSKDAKTPTAPRNITEEGVTIKTNSPYDPLESLAAIPCAKVLSFTKPTPIQRYAIPVIQKGHPLLVRAPTGMGKTLCFLLPMIESIRYSGMGVRVLIITPTRELAEQIKVEAVKLCEPRRLSVAALYGSKQGQSSYKNIDVLVATPGRLLDYLGKKKVCGEAVQNFVLDEADKLLEMGFEKDIRAIKAYVNKNARVALFSATYHKSLERIINEFLPSDRYVIEIQNETVSSIKQTILTVEKKDETLYELLSKYDLKGGWKTNEDADKVMVFVERKVTASELEEKLKKAGLNCNSLHGDKEQPERLQILSRFKKGIQPLLIATSVAARGIDVKDVKAVVNYDFPKDIKEYIHRIGRTGREGKSGEAFSFVDNTILPSLVSELICVLKESGNDVPAFLTKRELARADSSRPERRYGSRAAHSSMQRSSPLPAADGPAAVSAMTASLSEMEICKSTMEEKSDSEDDLPGEW